MSDAASSPLAVSRIRPAYEQVAAQISDLILQGALVPGERLPAESELATTFGVSRGTVREALRALASRDLVHAVRGANGGTFVGRSDPSALSEYLQTGIGRLSGTDAITVEELSRQDNFSRCPAARLAAERRTEADVTKLRAALRVESAPVEGSPRFQHHRQLLMAPCSQPPAIVGSR